MMWDIQRATNLLGLTALVIVVVLFFLRMLGPLLSIVWGYFLIRTLWLFQNPWATELKFEVAGGAIFKSGVYIDQTSGQAFSQILLIPLAMQLMTYSVYRHGAALFIVFGFANTLCILINGYGILNASSLDAAMLAALVPVSGLWGVVFMIGILKASSATTAGLMLIAGGGAALILRHGKKLAAWLLVATIAAVTPLAVSMNLFSKLSIDNDRPVHWLKYFNYWLEHANLLVGFGPGSFQWVGPALYKFEGSNLYLQMHNDWLQLLFEGGLIGLGLAVAAYLKLLWLSRTSAPYFAAWVSVGVFCVSYHPLRFFPSALFIAYLAHTILIEARALERRKENQCSALSF